MKQFDPSIINFDEKGLVPVVVQSIDDHAVLMLAYMNKEAIQKTLDTQIAHYYSRSRQSLWKKGETSGNTQHVQTMHYDCDADSLLIKVKQVGVACHTGEYSCFHNPNRSTTQQKDILNALYDLLSERYENPKEKSYTSYLFKEGLDKILKKVGEETSEIIIGAKNKDKENTINEIADLTYHMLVMMVNEGITIDEIKTALEARRQ